MLPQEASQESSNQQQEFKEDDLSQLLLEFVGSLSCYDAVLKACSSVGGSSSGSAGSGSGGSKGTYAHVAKLSESKLTACGLNKVAAKKLLRKAKTCASLADAVAKEEALNQRKRAKSSAGAATTAADKASPEPSSADSPTSPTSPLTASSSASSPNRRQNIKGPVTLMVSER
jgi:hypothetical protein